MVLLKWLSMSLMWKAKWENVEGDGRWATDLGREVRGVTGSAGVSLLELLFIASG